MLHDPKHCSCSTLFNECHVISTVLQLLKLIQFILKKKMQYACLSFPKFCFEQTISVDFFFLCIYVDMIACLPNLIQCVKLNISCGIEHLLFLRKTK